MTTGLTIDDPRYFDRLAEVESAHWWSRAMWRIAENWLARAIRGQHRLSALDAGCGTGLNVERLARRPEVDTAIGVDVSSDALARARRYDHPWARATVLALPFPEKSFDIVTCFDVLQHVPLGKDGCAVCELARVVRPGGLVLIRANGRGWRHAEPGTRLYRLQEIAELLHSVGLTVRRSSYANCLPALAEEARSRIRPGAPNSKGSGGLRIRLRSSWINRLMESVSALETGMVGPLGGRLPFGHSTLVLAERDERGSSAEDRISVERRPA